MASERTSTGGVEIPLNILKLSTWSTLGEQLDSHLVLGLGRFELVFPYMEKGNVLSISTLSLRWDTSSSVLPVRGRCAPRTLNVAEKCDTKCTPARTVAARREALNLCRALWPLAKRMKMGDIGTHRICEKENCSGT